jgi:hypothetical protein
MMCIGLAREPEIVHVPRQVLLHADARSQVQCRPGGVKERRFCQLLLFLVFTCETLQTHASEWHYEVS